MYNIRRCLETVLSILIELKDQTDDIVEDRDTVLQRLDEARQDLLSSARTALTYSITEQSLLWDIVRFSGGEREDSPLIVPRMARRFEDDGSKQNDLLHTDAADRVILGGATNDFMNYIMPPRTPPPPNSVQEDEGINSKHFSPSPVSVLQNIEEISPEVVVDRDDDRLEVFTSSIVAETDDRSRTKATKVLDFGDVEMDHERDGEIDVGQTNTETSSDDKSEKKTDESSLNRAGNGRPFFLRVLERSVAIATALTLLAVGRMIPEHFERDFRVLKNANTVTTTLRDTKHFRQSSPYPSCIVRDRRAPFYLTGPDVLAGRG